MAGAGPRECARPSERGTPGAQHRQLGRPGRLGWHAGAKPAGAVSQRHLNSTMPRPQAPSRRLAVTTAWRWAFLGTLLGLILAFAVYAPAIWLAAALDKATSGQGRMIEARR